MEHTIMKRAPQPTALLFGGGGAKGAFQIGAWQALQETPLLGRIRAVAGCSVGALNAVLFALGDFEFAQSVWLRIQPSDLLTRGTDGAFFSREGLIRLIDQLPMERVRRAPIKIIVSVHHTVQKQPVFFELNGLPDSDIRTLLLASSAIPRVYAPERYLGAEYIDGSATPEGDQCIAPVYAQGHRELLLVTMRPQFSLYGGQSVGMLRTGNSDLTQQYPDCSFTIIKPLRPMGNLLTGTLSFAPEKIRARMEQGYADTKAALSGLYGEPETREAMNAVMTELMTQLFPDAAQLELFLRLYGSRFAPNLHTATMGGNVWYDNIYSVDGWRVQQQRTTGLQSHYRILDPENKRAAWVLRPQTLLDALRDFARSGMTPTSENTPHTDGQTP